MKHSHMEPPITNFFNLLTDELIYIILDHLNDDAFAIKSFSQVCKSFHTLESTHRTKLKPRRIEFFSRTFQRYPFISHLDFTLCPCIDDDTLKSLSLVWNSSLRSVDLTRSRLFSHEGLSALALNCTYLVEINLSNRTDLTDLAAKAIAEAVNLESLCLRRCKLITDFGIGCIAVKCCKLKYLGLRWCIRVTDFGAGLIAIKCKHIRSLDLSYLPQITEKCLHHILQLKYLEDLVLEHCIGLDDEGLATLKASCKSMKMLNLSKCQNISHIGLTSLINGAQNLEKLMLSHSLTVTTHLANCLQSFQRLKLIKLDGCMGTISGLKAIGNSCASLIELNLSKCTAVTDQNLSFLVKTHKDLEKLDITCCLGITHASIYSLTNLCSRLTSLRMESCSLVIRGSFLFIGRCQLLEELDVTDTEIDDEGLRSISRCTKLSSLKLGICLKITDYGLKHIASSCSKLKHLDLYRSPRITDESITAIALGCPSLEVINIAYNSNVTDTSLVSLSKCMKLRILEIRGCPQISSVGLSNITVRCRYLEMLDMKKCYKINDTGIIQLAQHSQNLKQIKLSYCSVTDVGLLALAGISCLQYISIFNLEGLTSNGLAAVLLACQNLTKVKLNTSFKSLLPQQILEYMKSRGCVLVWRNKAFETFGWE